MFSYDLFEGYLRGNRLNVFLRPRGNDMTIRRDVWRKKNRSTLSAHDTRKSSEIWYVSLWLWLLLITIALLYRKSFSFQMKKKRTRRKRETGGATHICSFISSVL